MSGVPNPGSDEARDSGCTCPVLDNSHGRGFMMGGKKSWWISENCPLHDNPLTTIEDYDD